MSPREDGKGRRTVPLTRAAIRVHGQGFAPPHVQSLKLTQGPRLFLLPIPFLALPLSPSTCLGLVLCSPLNWAPRAKPLWELKHAGEGRDRRLCSGAAAVGVGTNEHHLNNLFFIACALKLQECEVIFCPLLIIALKEAHRALG